MDGDVAMLCRPKRPNAEARVMFDMAADMRGLFTWNTKLVFLYVTAEYKTELNALNQIVIWDYIIENVEHAQLTVGRAQTMLLPRHHNEYPLIDQVKPCSCPLRLFLD